MTPHTDKLPTLEQLPFEDPPAFLFDEAREPVLPDGSEAVEMSRLEAIV